MSHWGSGWILNLNHLWLRPCLNSGPRWLHSNSFSLGVLSVSPLPTAEWQRGLSTPPFTSCSRWPGGQNHGFNYASFFCIPSNQQEAVGCKNHGIFQIKVFTSQPSAGSSKWWSWWAPLPINSRRAYGGTPKLKELLHCQLGPQFKPGPTYNLNKILFHDHTLNT